MSFRWQWLGSEDPPVASGRATFWFSERMVDFSLPNSTVAHVLAAAIEQELKDAKRDGAKEMVEAIEKVIGNIR